MSRASRAMSRSKVALLFVASQLGVWTGCNAILGNGYGAFDESAVTGNGEGGPEGDALVGAEGGLGADGQGMGDGGPGLDGNMADARLPDGGTCPRMVCPRMLGTALGAQRIALGTTTAVDYVYWASAGTLGRVDVDGNTSKSLDLSPTVSAPQVRDVAVTAAGVPFVTVPARGASKCATDLLSCAMGFIGSAGTSSSVGVDATNVYVGIADDGVGGGTIFRTPDLNATSSVTYVTGDKVLDLQLFGGTTYYRTATQIKRVDPVTKTVTVAVDPVDAPTAFATDGTKMVVTTIGANRQIRTCTLAAGTCGPVNTAAIVSGLPTAVLLYGTSSIVWAEGGSTGEIHRCDFPNCTNQELLAVGQDFPSDLAVDTGFIYWANHGDAMGAGGAIMKLPK